MLRLALVRMATTSPIETSSAISRGSSFLPTSLSSCVGPARAWGRGVIESARDVRELICAITLAADPRCLEAEAQAIYNDSLSIRWLRMVV